MKTEPFAYLRMRVAMFEAADTNGLRLAAKIKTDTDSAVLFAPSLVDARYGKVVANYNLRNGNSPYSDDHPTR